MKGLHNLKEDFIYRALRTDEDPYKNIVCKDPNSNRTIDQHVKDGLTFSSKYISTSAKFHLAQEWIETSLRKSKCKYNRSTTTIKIDMNYLKRNNPDLVNSAYNFADETVRRSVLCKDSCNYARKYEEVVFERLIPSQAICDVHVAGKGWIGTEPPRSEPTPISTSTLPSISTPITSTPSIFTLAASSTPIPTPNYTFNYTAISTPISTPLHMSTRSRVSRHLSPTLSANISSSLSIFNVSDISSASVSAFETSAGIHGVTTPSCVTAEKRRTGVKRSCEVDSEVKPTKYVCVDDEDTQSAVNKTRSGYFTRSTSKVVQSDDTTTERGTYSIVSKQDDGKL